MIDFPGTRLVLAVVVTLCMAPLTAQSAERPAVTTASGNARAEVMRANIRDGVLRIEVRFLATTEPFGGEIIYTASDANRVRVDAGDTILKPADVKGGAGAAPQELSLNFSYDIAKNPRVGSWSADFEAPPADVSEIRLTIPNLPVFEHVAVKR